MTSVRILQLRNVSVGNLKKQKQNCFRMKHQKCYDFVVNKKTKHERFVWVKAERPGVGVGS